MTKVIVQFVGTAEQVEHANEGEFLLDMERLLRLRWPDYDIRVLKAKQQDDSPLRIARSA